MPHEKKRKECMIDRAYIKNVSEEYWKYRKQTLELSPEQIWDGCLRIRFYSCMYEYFLYNEKISETAAEKLATDSSILAGCWELYLKYEELSVESWTDIDELIERYLQMGEKRK